MLQLNFLTKRCVSICFLFRPAPRSPALRTFRTCFVWRAVFRQVAYRQLGAVLSNSIITCMRVVAYSVEGFLNEQKKTLKALKFNFLLKQANYSHFITEADNLRSTRC